ncbi:MAG TPA: hypothetical protein VK914_05380 [bacterium]|jgi:hypothetical protein|nr:hypothetical protein [bacterium]
MKEMTSTHDDIEKRLAVFLGLGAFILSALEGMVRGYSLEGMLLQGVIVLTVTTACAWLFGAWLRAALRSSAPGEELPSNVERRSTNQYSLSDGAVVVPDHLAEPVVSEEVHQPLTGTVVNYTLPELNPAEVEALNAIAAAGPQSEPEAEAKAPAGRK